MSRKRWMAAVTAEAKINSGATAAVLPYARKARAAARQAVAQARQSNPGLPRRARA